MSFAKAKIQRFNETKVDCSPSPAKYNVATQSNSKASKFGIPQAEKFTIKKHMGSPPNSEYGSIHSTPCFQTPTVPKKKKFFGLGSSSSKSHKTSDYLEELKEKTVECNNKDIYIKEITEQIEEMKVKLCHLEDDKERFIGDVEDLEKNILKLKSEKTQLEKDKEMLIQEFNDLDVTYNQIVVDLTLKHQTQLEVVNIDVSELKRVYEGLKCAIIQQLSELLTQVNEAVELNNKLADKSLRDLQKISDKHLGEIAMLNKKHETDKGVLEIKIQSLESDLDRYKKLSQESDDKIKLLEENFKEGNLLAEMQDKEKFTEIEESWKLKLTERENEYEAILKECQEISEYNIIQCELEKNHFKNLLSDKETQYNDLSNKFDELKNDLCTTKDLMVALKKEKRAYEMSINLFNDTIEVLKTRLINSDRDVEQLKDELAVNENKILDYEKKICDLSSELSEMQSDFDELEMQGESTSRVLIQRVRGVERDLLIKLAELENKIVNEKKLYDDAVEQLHEQQDVTNEAQELIENSNALIDQLESDCKMLESRNVELEVELSDLRNRFEEELEEAAEIRKKYIEKSGKFDELSQQFEQLLQELDELKLKTCQLETLSAPFQDLLEAYDEELRSLDKEDSFLAEAEKLNWKYSDVLNNHIHKLKVKNVFDLTEKSRDLLQQNVELESTLVKLNKTVEKLRKENDDLKKAGKKLKVTNNKENVSSPGGNKSLVRVESPGPLKEKN